MNRASRLGSQPSLRASVTTTEKHDDVLRKDRHSCILILLLHVVHISATAQSRLRSRNAFAMHARLTLGRQPAQPHSVTWHPLNNICRLQSSSSLQGCLLMHTAIARPPRACLYTSHSKSPQSHFRVQSLPLYPTTDDSMRILELIYTSKTASALCSRSAQPALSQDVHFPQTRRR